MKTPQELLAVLMHYETAVVIYKEAGSYAGAYKEIQQTAIKGFSVTYDRKLRGTFPLYYRVCPQNVRHAR